MDLSDGGDLDSIREILLEAAPITFGPVPIYQAYWHAVDKYKNPLNITEDDFLNAFEKHAKDGVDYTTIHSGITKDLAQRVLEVKRHAGIVSKGGTITAAWMLKYEDYDIRIMTHDASRFPQAGPQRVSAETTHWYRIEQRYNVSQ